MRRSLIALLGSAVVAIFAVGCAQSDAGVTTNVKTKFATDSIVKARQIDVDTKDHVVTLSGEVDSDIAKDRAALLARETDGVKDVVNNLRVTPPAAPTSGTLEDRARDLGDSAAEFGKKTGEAAKDLGRDTANLAREGADKAKNAATAGAEAVTDAAITTAIKSRFIGNDKITASDISVDTTDHVVTLTGSVASAAERAEAVRVARSTDGVHQVRDRLTVGKRAK